MPIFPSLRDLVERFPIARPHFDRMIPGTTPPWFEAEENTIGMTMLRRNDKEWIQQDLRRRRREEGVYAPALPRTLIPVAAAGTTRRNRSGERTRPFQQQPTIEHEAIPLSYEGEGGRRALLGRERNRHHQRTSYDHANERSIVVAEGRTLHQDLPNLPEKRIRKQQSQEEREWVNFYEAGGQVEKQLEQREREQLPHGRNEAESREKEHLEHEAIHKQKQENLCRERLGKDEQQRKQEHTPARRGRHEKDARHLARQARSPTPPRRREHQDERRKDQQQEPSRKTSRASHETKQEHVFRIPSVTTPSKASLPPKKHSPTTRPQISERREHHHHRRRSETLSDTDRRLDHKHRHHHRSPSPAIEILQDPKQHHHQHQQRPKSPRRKHP